MSKALEKSIHERNEKDEKYYTVYDHYRPNYQEQIATRKFYSKYEATEIKKPADPNVLKNVINALDVGPKEKHIWPETENQCYGWFTEPLVDIDRSDFRFYHPTKSSALTKHELIIRKERKLEPKFTGIPFKTL